MKKTKIICTLGPASNNEEMLTAMLNNGMNVARLNFSHGSHEYHQEQIELVRRVRDKLKMPVAIMLDTKGPEIRTGNFENGPVKLCKGDTFTLTTRDIPGSQDIVSITYKDLPRQLSVGSHVLIDDGMLKLEVKELSDTDIICTALNNGQVSNHKGINVPNIHLDMEYLSPQDESDLLFGIEQDVDYIAASFVRRKEDVIAMRNFLNYHGGHSIRIISKIENIEGIDNFDEILQYSDGIMVARGDMGVEVEYERLPGLQKQFIMKCYRAGKVVITATQMLESMVHNTTPTRAEITDVANAVFDGTSAIMLSGETAAGRYPVEAVKTMDAIARKTESSIDCSKRVKMDGKKMSITAATAHAACTTALDIGADAILTVSQGGTTAQMVSRFRTSTTVVALLLDPQVRRQMNLYWGVAPIMMPYAGSTDELVDFAVQAAEDAGLVKQGDIVVVTAGVPVGVAGTTNMIRVRQVGGSLINGVGVGSKLATGRLCVCRTVEEAAEKFHPGDVLVVPYTNNDFLPYIREAAAVICEEGSTEGHAATVGLTLDKAVIVGAVAATKRLEDGVLVSVDCARGVVQTLPQ